MKIAIITAQGLGDGLQMMIAANHLKQNSYDVTLYNRYLPGFKKFFKGFKFKYPFSLNECKDFDYVLLEHDNSKLAYEIVRHLKKTPKPKLVIFMTNYSYGKHGPINQSTFCFNQNKTMLENIVKATKIMFDLNEVSFDNGISIPNGLIHRKNNCDIVIHPSASNIEKSWTKRKFIKLAKLLKEKSFNPIFVVSKQERPSWLDLEKSGFQLANINSLDDLAKVLYESYAFIGNDSGPAHLASNLKLPVLVIGKKKRNLKYWQPSWYFSDTITPSKYIPNLKFFRLREKKWRLWIRPKRVLQNLEELLKK